MRNFSAMTSESDTIDAREHDFAIRSKKVLSLRNHFYYVRARARGMQSENDRLIGIRDR